uniref:Ribosomal protein S19 n=1 Tax=Plasmopara viticola TaxID=143451 RepID=A0A6C0N9L4_PLAVT|nr:ribosomal protein S19 [Plasmopara viticola]QHW07493.1 ribosomal protein S19 [Plasmopara viticola]
MSRSKYKGPFFKVNLLKKKNWIKIINKNLTILPEYNKHIVSIYNGKNFINLKINDKMIGFKFGEFIYTRKKHIYKKKIVYGSKNRTN